MEFVTSIYSIEQLNNLKDELDCALLMVNEYSLNHKDMKLDEALDFCIKNQIKPIVALDRIFTPSDMNEAEKCLMQHKDFPILFYVTDLGVANIAMKHNMEDRIIFDPKTMICNSMDLSLYASYGFHALGISSEITLEDAKVMEEKTNAPVFYQAFGYRMMFYSRRHLISLYETKNGASYPHLDVYFQEATRKDYFPGFQNENGTLMYRSYVLNFMSHLTELSNMKYLYLESYRISDDAMKSILYLYKGILKNEVSEADAEKIFDSLELKSEEGFMNKDSVYEKGELKQ